MSKQVERTSRELAGYYRVNDIKSDDVWARCNTAKGGYVETGEMIGSDRGILPYTVIPGDKPDNGLVVRLNAITDEPFRPESLTANAIISKITGMGVLDIGSPGVENRVWRQWPSGCVNRLSPEQATFVRKTGNFAMIGTLLEHAVGSVIDKHSLGDKIIVEGMSLGGSFAAGLVNHVANTKPNDRKFDLAGVVTADPVGWANPKPSLQRMLQFSQASEAGEAYLDEAGARVEGVEVESFSYWLKRSLSSFEANKTYWGAVAKGRGGKEILDSAKFLAENEIPVAIYAFGDSEFQTRGDLIDLTRRMGGAGVNCAVISVLEGRHGLTMLPGFSADIISHVRGMQEG